MEVRQRITTDGMLSMNVRRERKRQKQKTECSEF